MADQPAPARAPTSTTPATVETQQSSPVPAVNVISGAESLLGTETHVGIAVRVKSSGGPSVLVIPDVNGAKTGAYPVYITKPITLELEKLQTFLKNKGVTLPEALSNLLKDTSIACNAFYFTANNGPLLMMFNLQFNKGLIASLTGDKDIGELFDIEGVAVRVFRCAEDKFPALQKYAEELSA
jgi:hypothetical protein